MYGHIALKLNILYPYRWKIGLISCMFYSTTFVAISISINLLRR